MASVLSDVTAFGSIKGGRLFIRNRRSFNEDLRRFKDDTEVEIEVRPLRATRSRQANAYLWGVVYALLSDYTGHTPMELHDFFKQKFIPVDVVLADRNGEVKYEGKIPGSTRSMKVDQFYEFVERIRAFAAELGCIIPDPQGRFEDEELVS